jgi:hypothetical protein
MRMRDTIHEIACETALHSYWESADKVRAGIVTATEPAAASDDAPQTVFVEDGGLIAYAMLRATVVCVRTGSVLPCTVLNTPGEHDSLLATIDGLAPDVPIFVSVSEIHRARGVQPSRGDPLTVRVLATTRMGDRLMVTATSLGVC